MSDGVCKLVAEDVVELSVETSEDAQQIARLLRGQNKWQEVVPGLESVSVLYDPTSTTPEDVMDEMRKASEAASSVAHRSGPSLEIQVRYGGEYGPDLTNICDALGISEAEFIHSHTSSHHRIDMIGFTPGFAYVSGLDTSLSVPRRSMPRPRLPAGSVGVSDTYTGLYALAGPGGWPIIGRTDLRLFDPNAEDPFLLRPGQRLIFKSV